MLKNGNSKLKTGKSKVGINNGMLSSANNDWATPPELFEKLDAEFHFTLDVCALPTNAKCERFFSPSDDGLAQPWDGTCWMNPPYGAEISNWMEKAYREHCERGLTVVCLVPARTDTKWWHDYAKKGEIRLIRGRVKFVGAKSSAPFPSAIIVFRERWWEAENPHRNRADTNPIPGDADKSMNDSRNQQSLTATEGSDVNCESRSMIAETP